MSSYEILLKEFANQLSELLQSGRRPKTEEGEPWKLDEFAEQADVDSEATVRNWRDGRTLPNRIEGILTAFFGADRASDSCQKLRAAYLAAREAKRRASTLTPDQTNQAQVEPTVVTEEDQDPSSGAASETAPILTTRPRTAIGPFYGRFIRLFIKPILPREEELAVHLGDFAIKPNGSDIAAGVEVKSFMAELNNYNQSPENYELEIPSGSLRVVGGIMEMVLKYGSNIPDSHYLGPAPAGIVDSFLLMNLDIKFDTHEVGVQPMLFIRIKDSDAYPTAPVGKSSKLFPALKAYLSATVRHDDDQFELSVFDKKPSQKNKLLKNVMNALEDLKISKS